MEQKKIEGDENGDNIIGGKNRIRIVHVNLLKKQVKSKLNRQVFTDRIKVSTFSFGCPFKCIFPSRNRTISFDIITLKNIRRQ
jgi:hypothetical protein